MFTSSNHTFNRQRAFPVHKLALALTLAVPGFHQAALAAPGLTVDLGAAQLAGLAVATNGTPIVNIVSPDRNGLSHNTFTDFNVGQPGLILNNSSNTSQTVLGGTIAGNAQLGAMPANVILNEVMGKAGSSIKGMLEVAGQRAHVIVVNPNGITADGAGFINANRVSLVAGQAVFDESKVLAGYKADQGQIRIEGAGLNAPQVEQVDLIARTLQVNAALQAKTLGLIAQEGSVAASELGSYSVNGVSYGGQPVVALDVGKLGSIHANSIYMVASSDGVGVNVAGKVKAVAGDLQISSLGKVLLAPDAELNAQDKLLVTGSLENNGEIRSHGDMRLAGTSFLNSHVIHSDGKLTMIGASIHNRASGSITSAKRITTFGDLRNEGTLIQNHQVPDFKPALITDSVVASAPVIELNVKHPVVAQDSVEPPVTIGVPAKSQAQGNNLPVNTQQSVQLNERAAAAQVAMQSRINEMSSKVENNMSSNIRKMNERATAAQATIQSRMNKMNSEVESKMSSNIRKMNEAMAAAFSSNRFQ